MRSLVYFSLLLVTSVARLHSYQVSAWTHFTITGVPSIVPASTVYDPGSNRLVDFGGLVNGTCCTVVNDTWVLLNANGTAVTPQWQQLSPVGPLPPARIKHSAVYDESNNRMIIFGGAYSTTGPAYAVLFNDVWVLSNANGRGGTPTWVQLTPNGTPPAAREGHRAVYDPSTNRMIVFGGGNNGLMVVPNDTWVLTNANGLGGPPQWIQLSPLGTLPVRREDFVVGYDPTGNVLTVFGGCCFYMGDLWTLSNANGLGGPPTWQQVPQRSLAPGALLNGNYGYDQGTNSLVFFGGLHPSGPQNDVWVLNNANASGPPTWMNPIPNGAADAPPPSWPFGTYDSVHRKLMVLVDAANEWVLDASQVGIGPATGTIGVTTNLTSATFTVTGPTTFTGSGTSMLFNNAPAGTYTITFGAVSQYLTPPSQTATLNGGRLVSFGEGMYTPITLTLCPSASPQCAASLSQMTFSNQQGSSQASPQQLIISSNALGIPFTATALTNSTDGPWLSVTPSRGTTPTVLNISVASGLKMGTYSGHILVASNGTVNSPQDLLITLAVTTGVQCNVTSVSIDSSNSNQVISSSAIGSGCTWAFTVKSLLPNIWTNIVQTSVGLSKLAVRPADNLSALYAEAGILSFDKSIVYNVQFSSPKQSVTVFADPTIQTSSKATIINVVQGIVDLLSIKYPIQPIELAIEDVAVIAQTVDQMPHFRQAISGFFKQACVVGVCVPAPNVEEGTRQMVAFLESPTELGLLTGLLTAIGIDVVQTGIIMLLKTPGAVASFILEIATNIQTAFGHTAGSVSLVAH